MNDKGNIRGDEYVWKVYLTYKSGYSGLLYGGELESWTMDFLGVDGLKTNDEDDEPSED